MDILLHCHQAGRGDLTQQQGKRIILITALELQPGIIHVQISLGRDLTWYLTSSRDQQFYLRWLIFSFSPAISTQHFMQVQKLCMTSSSHWNNNNHYNIMWSQQSTQYEQTLWSKTWCPSLPNKKKTNNKTWSSCTWNIFRNYF